MRSFVAPSPWPALYGFLWWILIIVRFPFPSLLLTRAEPSLGLNFGGRKLPTIKMTKLNLSANWKSRKLAPMEQKLANKISFVRWLSHNRLKAVRLTGAASKLEPNCRDKIAKSANSSVVAARRRVSVSRLESLGRTEVSKINDYERRCERETKMTTSNRFRTTTTTTSDNNEQANGCF